MRLDDYPRWQRWLGWLVLIMLTAIAVFFIAGGTPSSIGPFFIGYASRTLSYNLYLAMPALLAIGAACLVAMVGYQSWLSTPKSAVLVSYEELEDRATTIEFLDDPDEYGGEGIELTTRFPDAVMNYYNQLDGIVGNQSCVGGPYATGVYHEYYITARTRFHEGDALIQQYIQNFDSILNKNGLQVYLDKQVKVPIPLANPEQKYDSQLAIKWPWLIKDFAHDTMQQGMYKDLATPVLLRLWQGTSAIHHYKKLDTPSLMGDGGQVWLWGLEGYYPIQMVWKGLVESSSRIPQVPVNLESYQRTLIQQFIMGVGDEDRDHLWYDPIQKTLLCADWSTSWPNPQEDKQVKISSLSLFSEVYKPFLASVKQWVHHSIRITVLTDFYASNADKFSLSPMAYRALENRIKLLKKLFQRDLNLTPHALYAQYEKLKSPCQILPYEARLKAVLTSAEIPVETLPTGWIQDVEKGAKYDRHAGNRLPSFW
jgi:hypothetical protein